jgi:hypothetical protein
MTLVRHAVAPMAGVLLSGWLLLGTRGLDHVARDGQLGPGFWPRIALIGLGLTCLVKFVDEWRRHRIAKPRQPAALQSGMRAELARRKLGAAMAAIVVYVLVTPAIGFPLATALFIVAFMSLCGARSIAVAGVNAVVGTGLLLYVFIKLVYLPLPKGDGPFDALSLMLYRALHIF